LCYRPALLGGHNEPHVRWRVVWGAQQARRLPQMMLGPGQRSQNAVIQVTNFFDKLFATQQPRLHNLIVGHQRRCHNFPCQEFS
jgi:hypothetical protein